MSVVRREAPPDAPPELILRCAASLGGRGGAPADANDSCWIGGKATIREGESWGGLSPDKLMFLVGCATGSVCCRARSAGGEGWEALLVLDFVAETAPSTEMGCVKPVCYRFDLLIILPICVRVWRPFFRSPNPPTQTHRRAVDFICHKINEAGWITLSHRINPLIRPTGDCINNRIVGGTKQTTTETLLR